MGTSLVRVTHPFHPLNGRLLVCVGERYNRYGIRLLLRVDEQRICSVPRQWTDVVAPDPEIVISGGRSLFRVGDLLELADLVSRLVEQEQPVSPRKAKDAAGVRPISPPGAVMCRGKPRTEGAQATHGGARALDNSPDGGIIGVTRQAEVQCRSEPIASLSDGGPR